MKVPFVDLKKQYDSIKPEIDKKIAEVINESAFIGGKYLKSFEQSFSKYLGVNHTIGCGNGTDALFIALKTLGIGEGDEVITAANSFVATAEAISLTGAKVIFVDVDEKTYNIDINEIKKAINSKTKVILPVHLYGKPADMNPILKLAKEFDLFVVEDCAQAHGALYDGKKVGTFGDFGCFSFYPGKNLGAYGDGGALVTDSSNLAKTARMFSNHGRVSKYDHEFIGLNSRLDGLQAAVLDIKLNYLDLWSQKRRDIAHFYSKSLKGELVVPIEEKIEKSVYHLYVVQVENRDQLQAFLKEKGISTGIHYPIPLPELKAYKNLIDPKKAFPRSSYLSKRILSLPIHGCMDLKEAEYVVKMIRTFVNKKNIKDEFPNSVFN